MSASLSHSREREEGVQRELLLSEICAHTLVLRIISDGFLCKYVYHYEQDKESESVMNEKAETTSILPQH